MSRFSRVICTLSSVLVLAMASAAQTTSCQAPAIRAIPPGMNLFSDKQEMELSGVLHRQLEQDVKMIEDESLTGELQRVGDRIARSLPQSGIKFHYYVIDIPEANAFSLPGGNIYFARKIIASFRSEDELAAVMAHEMGHIVTHQRAIELSRLMRSVLGISKFDDEDDIEAKYNDLFDSYRKKPGAFRMKDREEQDQLGADQVSVYALAASGYDVKAMPAWWDRFTENKGKKGNFLTDAFGGTKEESRRFRDMLKNAQSLSVECIAKHSEVSDSEFKRWQSGVAAYNGIGHREKLDGLIARKTLTPPLRSELMRLRVSPDGKYILAQDQGSINILNRADLKSVFEIEADDARSVQFTEDSSAISFYTIKLLGSPRIETWDIADKTMRQVNELHILHGCNQAALSPNVKYFGCISPGEPDMLGIPMDLRIFNIETGELITEKKNLLKVDTFSQMIMLLALASGSGSINEVEVGALHFTPDSKYLLFGRQNLAYAVECATGSKLNLPKNVQEIMHGDFSFLNGNEIVGVAGEKGAALKFPGGETVYSNLRMGWAHIDAASKGDYVLLHPLKDYAVGVFSLKENKFLLGSKKGTADIYEDEYFRERLDGEIASYDLLNKKDLSSVALHEGPLGRITASAISEDLNYVAISGTIRGAIWDLSRNTRVSHVRRFDAMDVDSSGFAVGDFPAEGEQKRQFAQIDTTKDYAASFEATEGAGSRQVGPYLVERVAQKKNEWSKNITLRVKVIKTNTLLWERTFPNGIPAYHMAPEVDSLVFLRDASTSEGKAMLQSSDELRAKLQSLQTRDHAYLVEALDLKTGKTVGQTAIDTGKGSFRFLDAFSAGKNLVVVDDHDRVEVFGWDGHRKGRFHSHFATATRDGHLLAADVGRGKVAVYDLEKFSKLDDLDFPSRVAMFKFSASGDRLLVVTRDQKAYYFDTKKLGSQQIASN